MWPRAELGRVVIELAQRDRDDVYSAHVRTGLVTVAAVAPSEGGCRYFLRVGGRYGSWRGGEGASCRGGRSLSAAVVRCRARP